MAFLALFRYACPQAARTSFSNIQMFESEILSGLACFNLQCSLQMFKAYSSFSSSTYPRIFSLGHSCFFILQRHVQTWRFPGIPHGQDDILILATFDRFLGGVDSKQIPLTVTQAASQTGRHCNSDPASNFPSELSSTSRRCWRKSLGVAELSI